jgi:Nucleotidyl transferase AbiEii toxin, Type IV TA system
VQAELLAVVGPWSAARGFYLAGGTAVALWLGHRRSIDFDFFGDDALSAPRRFVNELAAVLKDPIVERQVSRGTVYLESRSVTMSWFATATRCCDRRPAGSAPWSPPLTIWPP